MAMTVKNASTDSTIVKRPIAIWEMVGISGAGKTTLRQRLCQYNERIQFRIPPTKSSYLSFIVKHTFLWLPIYFRNGLRARFFTRKEIAMMGYLETWIPYLQMQTLTKGIVVLLDPGSIYWISELQNHSSDFTRSQQYKQWMEKKILQWSNAIDVIIWLDAPDELLFERVLMRDEWHEAKEQSKEKNFERFARERKSFKQIIAMRKKLSRPRVFSFCSDQTSTEEMATRILAEINL